MRFAGLEVTYNLKQARLVAIVDDGGAIVENLDLTFTEGRTEVGYGADPDDEESHERNSLEFFSRFGATNAPEPLASEMVGARIVITGTVRPWGVVELRGRGMVGYDDKGNLEGYFAQPPKITIDKLRDLPANDGAEHKGAWEAASPRPPEQYKRANRGRQERDDDFVW